MVTRAISKESTSIRSTTSDSVYSDIFRYDCVTEDGKQARFVMMVPRDILCVNFPIMVGIMYEPADLINATLVLILLPRQN